MLRLRVGESEIEGGVVEVVKLRALVSHRKHLTLEHSHTVDFVIF